MTLILLTLMFAVFALASLFVVKVEARRRR